MRSLKTDKWKVIVPLAGLLFLLLLMVLIPLSASAYEGTSGAAIAGTVRTAPTVDVTATMTALNEEKLRQEIQQLKDQNNPDLLGWLRTNAAIILSTLVVVTGGLIGLFRWFGDRRDSQDKELKAQAEERFKAAVAALGDEKESVQVGGAILLRSFLHKEDKKSYERYYTQVFDLAVAYLSLPSTSHPSEDPDGIPFSPEVPNAPLPLTPLRQALISAFTEAFPLACGRLGQVKSSVETRFLDASRIRLDRAYLASCDLKYAWMRKATFRGASLFQADLMKANLYDADFSSLPESIEADLRSRETYLGWAVLSGAALRYARFIEANLFRTKFIEADLREADFRGARFTGTDLRGANLSNAKLGRAVFKEYRLPKDRTKNKIRGIIIKVNLRGADLSDADLSDADLSGTNLEVAQSLRATNLRGAKGLTKKQLEVCKAKGAIIDEDTTTDSPEQDTAPAPSQSTDLQAPSSAPALVTTPPASTDGSSSASAQPNTEP